MTQAKYCEDWLKRMRTLERLYRSVTTTPFSKSTIFTGSRSAEFRRYAFLSHRV